MAISFFESTQQPLVTVDPAASYAPGSRKKIIVEPLSDTQWRVCDTRWPEHDARSLRGYIEKTDDVFEVMQLDHGFEWFSYVSLDEAIAHFATLKLSTTADNENVLVRLRARAS